LYHGFFGRLARFLEQRRDVQDVTRQVFQGVQQRRAQMTRVRIVIATQQNSRATVRLGHGLACTAVSRESIFNFCFFWDTRHLHVIGSQHAGWTKYLQARQDSR